MSWRAISTIDVLAEFTPQETAMLNAIQGVATALAGILTNVIGQARGNIGAGGYPLGGAGAVPDQLRGEVIALARWKWLISFPQLKMLQTKERKDAADEAEKKLERVANQKLNIESPVAAGVSPASASGKAPIKGRMGL